VIRLHFGTAVTGALQRRFPRFLSDAGDVAAFQVVVFSEGGEEWERERERERML